MTFSLAFRPTTVAALGIALLLALSLLPAPSAASSTSPPICELSEETIVGVQGSTGGPIEIVGTKGNDVILGSSGPDVITGLGGDDVICGAGGDDFIDGGSGVDQLDGGSGERDACFGGSMAGGAERDTAINCEATKAVP